VVASAGASGSRASIDGGVLALDLVRLQRACQRGATRVDDSASGS
jgi:hypothetical protein